MLRYSQTIAIQILCNCIKILNFAGVFMKITKEMIQAIASPTIYKRGVEYYKEGRIHIRYIDENSVKAVADSDGIYNVSVTVKDDKVSEYFCTCPYYHTMGCACKHIVAALKMCGKELSEGGYSENENDKIAAMLCKKYVAQSREKQRVKLSFRLNIYTGLDKCGFSLALKTGLDTPEPVTNANSFLFGIYNDRKITLSKHKHLSTDEYSFGEEETAVLDILYELLESRNSEYSGKEEIYIGEYTFKRIIPYLIKLDCEYRVDGGTCPDMRIIADNPDILVDINAHNNKISMVVNERGTALTSDGSWFLYQGDIYQSTPDWQAWFMPIYKTIISAKRTHIDFCGNNAVDFVVNALPQVKGNQGVILTGFEEMVVDAKPDFEIFLDSSKSGISAVPIVHYGAITLKLSKKSDFGEKIIVRNLRLEEEVLSFFEGFEQQGEKYLLTDEDLIFNFISEKLPRLESYAQVVYNTAISVENTLPIQAKVGYLSDVNLLEVDFESDLSPEEVSGILKAIRLNKPYYKNDDGRYFNLSDKKNATINLINSLDFDADDVKNRKKLIASSNSLYLSQLKKSHIIKSDKSFDDFLKKIQKISPNIPKSIDDVLRKYQRDGVHWLTQLYSCGFGGILADDMGLGKTLQVIAFTMSIERDKPVLVIAPSSLIYNWQNEILKFAPFAKSIIIEGVKEERIRLLDDISDFDFVITSYPLMRRDMELYKQKEFACLFIDEAQYIKNPGTINAKSVKKIKADGYFAITGTPIENSLSELWSIFDFVMKGYLYSNREFIQRYQNAIMKEEDTDALNELKSRIHPFILRRMKKEVLKELPEKIENTIYTSLEPEQKRMYDAFLKVAKNEISYMNEIGNENRMKILSLLMRLRQICCHPALFDAKYKDESGKLLLFEELISTCIQAGHRILVFSQFTSMLSIIKKHLDAININYFYLDGQTSPHDRTSFAERFNKGEKEVFLISLKAGGTGLNLTGADMVIHFDPWWNPAVMEQASDRAHRIGQKKVVQVIKLAAKGTIEEQIIKLQEKKKELADGIITENSKMLSGLTKEEILEIFG